MGSPQKIPLGIFRLTVSRGLECPTCIAEVQAPVVFSHRDSKQSRLSRASSRFPSQADHPIHPRSHKLLALHPPSFTSQPNNALPPYLGPGPSPHSLESYSARFCAANLYPTMDGITTCWGSSPPPNLIPCHQSRSTTHQTENTPAVSPRNLSLLNCCHRFLMCLTYLLRVSPIRLIPVSNLQCLSLVPLLGCRLVVRFALITIPSCLKTSSAKGFRAGFFFFQRRGFGGNGTFFFARPPQYETAGAENLVEIDPNPILVREMTGSTMKFRTYGHSRGLGVAFSGYTRSSRNEPLRLASTTVKALKGREGGGLNALTRNRMPRDAGGRVLDLMLTTLARFLQ